MSGTCLLFQITVVPINDGPIIQFNSSADPNVFAPEQDRRRQVSFREEDQPVVLLPAVTTLRDVDSLNAGGAVVTLNGTLDGEYEGLGVDRDLASSSNIHVSIMRSGALVTLTLSGDATVEQYRQVHLIVTVMAC